MSLEQFRPAVNCFIAKAEQDTRLGYDVVGEEFLRDAAKRVEEGKRLLARIDAAAQEARDAARYRWLRDLSGNAPTDTPSAMLLDDYGDSFKYIDGPQLDAAIDAAMQAQAGDAEVRHG